MGIRRAAVAALRWSCRSKSSPAPQKSPVTKHGGMYKKITSNSSAPGLQGLDGANQTCRENNMGRCGIPHFAFKAIVEFDLAWSCRAPHVEVEDAAKSRPFGQVILPFAGIVFGIQLLHEAVEPMSLAGRSDGGDANGIGNQARRVGPKAQKPSQRMGVRRQPLVQGGTIVSVPETRAAGAIWLVILSTFSKRRCPTRV